MTGLTLSNERTARLARAYDEASRARRLRTLGGLCVLILVLLASGWMAEVKPAVFVENFGKFTSYVDRIFRLDSGARVWADPQEWFWGLPKWTLHLLETVMMAYVGTLSGAIMGFVLAFFAASNMTTTVWLRFAARRFLEFCRTVPELVFALIFVASFGLGPMPGIMAIAIHTGGALGKLFGEIVENIDMKPVEGVAASGGTWVEQIRFAVVPQVLSGFASYTLLRFEVNVRGAAVLGFVGAGGIGEDLILTIRRFYYSDVSAILLLIIVAVVVIDHLSEWIRHRLTDAGAHG